MADMNPDSARSHASTAAFKVYAPPVPVRTAYTQALSVLIADDDARTAQLVARNCENLGYRVIGNARKGKDAVALTQELVPDLVLMDINMPGMDGIEAATAILEKRKVPIIMMTGNTDESVLERIRFVDISGYLVKPFSPAQLKVAVYLARCAMQDAQPELQALAG